MNKTLFAAAVLAFVPLAIPSAPSADASAAGPRHSDEPKSGLAVSMDQITPAYLQPGEPVQVSGTITNLDREAWGDVQVYLLAPTAPATTTRQLAQVASSLADTYSGDRITNDGLFLELGDIAPSESVPYQLNIPFAQLNIPPDQYGVYTLGVHALGDNPIGRRETAGRARSFIPFMPPHSPSIGVATIWPFRAEIVRRPDGEYMNRDELIEDISPGGRLRRMLDLARKASSTPISILVDPALLDALERIAEDNTGRPGTPMPPSESPTATDDTGAEDLAPLTEEQRTARDFLDAFQRLASQHTLWTEGYGGPDLTALAGDYDGTRMFRTITRTTRATMKSLGLTHADRAYVPTGNLDVGALERIGPKTAAIFVNSDQVRGWKPSDGPVGTVRSHGSRARVVVTHDDLLDGSPAPGPTDTALQIRQRLLAETALLSLRADAEGRRSAASIAVLADDNWDPGADALQSNFFAAYGAPWVQASTLDAERAAGPLPAADHLRVAHPDEQVDPPLPDSLARSADQIRGRGVIMWAITDDRRILNYYDQSAALTVSEQWRPTPEVSQAIADQMIEQLDSQIGRVHIEAPEFVTLSSSSGRFPLTITNGLAWTIKVGVRLAADDGIKIQQDEPIEVEPQQSTTVNVQVHAEDVGVTEVRARLTTPNGRAFGEPVTFKMRSSVVGTVIWVALGAAGAIIVFAVGRRVRRSAKSKTEQQPGAAAEPTAGDTR